MSRQQRDVLDQTMWHPPLDLGGGLQEQRPLLDQMTNASPGRGRKTTDRTPMGGVEDAYREGPRHGTADTLTELFPVPGEVPDSGGYDGFVAVLDRVRAGEGGEVLGHVVAELWWFEGGAGVELWSDFVGEPPVRPEEILDGGCRPGGPGAHREGGGAT